MPRGGALLRVPKSVEEPGRIVACGLSAVQKARLADALRFSSSVTTVGSADSLYELLRDRVESLDLIAVGQGGSGTAVEHIVRRVRAERPHLPVVVFLSAAASEPSPIPAVAEAGAHEIILCGYNDEGVRLRAAIAAARRSCTERWVLGTVAAVIPARLLRFVEAVIADPGAVTSVPVLADRVGVHRKTLYNWCRISRFFKPGELLVWSRLALVAHYLDVTRCSVDTIARDLGYASPSSLRNTFKRYTGLTPTELRVGGGRNRFVNILENKLNEHRALPRRD